MLRLLHTADVHLGARHTDLGDRASLQRERQFAAFRSAVDVAIAEAVDLVLIAGDLFDSNTQPRRSVERVGAELGRLVRASIRTVIIPGTHDVYDAASIYRAYDLAAIARAGGDWIAVLTPDRSEVHFPSLDTVIYGRVFATKRAPSSPLEGLVAKRDGRATWRIGMLHGALAIPGRTDGDEVVFSEDEIAKTGLDYLALGHWHSYLEGHAGGTTYAYSGAPEPVAVDQDGAGQVLLVTLDDRGAGHRVSIQPRRVGQTRCESLDLDVSGVRSQPDLVNVLARHADPNLILDVRLTGLFPDDLDLAIDEVERELNASFFRLRIRDLSIPALPDDTLPPADTVLGAFVRNIEGRIAAIESGDRSALAEFAATDVEPLVETAPASGNGHRTDAGVIRDAEDLRIVVDEAGLTAPESGAPDAEAIAEAIAESPIEVPVVEAAGEETELEGTGAQHADETTGGSADLDEVPIEPPEALLAPVPPGAVAEAEAAFDQSTVDELADLREVLRLGRHLLEGRQVTL